MLIANPIYDVVFKRMMEHDRIAKFFIGAILEKTVESIVVRPQEFTYMVPGSKMAFYRLDFIATIKTEFGERYKVLIEVQKALGQLDIRRFRAYLAEQYRRTETIDDQEEVLPIIAIYILGTNLANVHSACTHVARSYFDMIDRVPIQGKNDFIEAVSHDCYVVQVNRIGERYKTLLDKSLSVFEQAHFIDLDQDTTKDYKHSPDSEVLQLLTEVLHHAGVEPAQREELEKEQEAWRSIYAIFGTEVKGLRTGMKEKEKLIEELKLEKDEKERALGEKEKALGEKEKTIEELKLEKDEKDKIIEELKRKLGEK